MTVEKNLSPSLRYDLVQSEGNSCSSTSLKKSKVSSINLRDKLQFVNSVKRLVHVFDLTKIPFLKRLIGISRLIVEVLNDQNLFTVLNLANWFWSYAGINLTGYHPPREPRAYAPKCVPSPGAFAQQKMPGGRANKG